MNQSAAPWQPRHNRWRVSFSLLLSTIFIITTGLMIRTGAVQSIQATVRANGRIQLQTAGPTTLNLHQQNGRLLVTSPNGVADLPASAAQVVEITLADATNTLALTLSDGAEVALSHNEAGILLNTGSPLQGSPLQLTAAQLNQAFTLHGSNIVVDGPVAAENMHISGTMITLLPGSELTAVHNLTLHARDTLSIHDSAERPFVAQAGDELTLQGDQLLDISVLDHSASRLASGGNMQLISAAPVQGDALYLSGGQVQIAQLNGRSGHLISPKDPVILASGDVTLGNYTGASLHIVAGGAVTLDAVTITGTDLTANAINAANGTPFNGSDTIADLAAFNLSNGTAVAINGSTQPLLDVRAGVDWTTFAGGAPSNLVLPSGAVTPSFAAASSADITINGTVTVSQPQGMVLLTNQYRPNAALSGTISTAGVNVSSASAQAAGDIIMDSKGNITTGQLDAFAEALGTAVTAGDGGNITLLAPAGSLATTGNLNAFSRIPGNNSGDVGAGGTVLADTASGIAVSNGVNTFAFSNDDGGTGGGGNILLNTTSGDITVQTLNSSSFIITSTVPAANGGNIDLATGNGAITVAGDGFFTAVSSFSSSFGAGGTAGDVTMNATQGIAIGNAVRTYGSGINANGGNVSLQTSSGNLSVGDVLVQATASNSIGSGGNVVLLAANGAVTSGDISAFSNSFFLNNNSQDGGDITILAGAGDAQTGILESYTQARGLDGDTGDAGTISVTASQGIFVGGSINAYALAAQNNSNSGIAGNGGAVTLQATTAVSVTGGINAYSNADGPNGIAGNGANITATAPSGEVRIDGDLNAFASAPGFPSGDAGSSGSLTLQAGSGIFIPAGQLNAYAYSQEGTVGNGGNVTAVTVSGDIILETITSYARNTFAAASLGTGDGGNITVSTGGGQIVINPDSLLTFYTLNSESSGPDVGGNSGNINLSATQGITVNGNVQSSVFGDFGNGGDISLSSSNGDILATGFVNASAIENNSSPGDAGSILLQASNGAVNTGDVTAFSLAFFINNSAGSGGSITIEALGGDATTGQIASYSEARGLDGDTGSGGDIQVTTSGSLTTTGPVQAYSFSNINNNNSGIAATGGSVTLQASGAISITGGIETFSAAPGPNGVANNAGNVTATAVSDIAFIFVDARSRSATGTIGAGGTVVISSTQFVRGVGIPLFDGTDTIAANGLANSSAITITHGGAGITPFIVGDASTNGTLADITTGDAAIPPIASFLFSHFEAPNIWILSVPLPITLTKSATPDVDAPFQSEITYTIVLTNPTTLPANGVTLADTLPAEVNFNRWVQQPAGAAVVGDVLNWTGNLPANSSLTFEFVVDHVGAAGDVFTNTAVFTHPQSLASGEASATVSIEGASDVTITKTVDTTTAVPGDTIQYTINFSNTGAGTARNVLITDTIPVELTNLNVTNTGAAITPIGGNTFAWTVEDLAPGASGQIVITGDLVTPLAVSTTIDNTAVIAASTFESNTTNNEDTATVTILNAGPVAVDDTDATNEDTLVNITVLGNDSDVNGDALTLSAVGAAANGTAVANGNTVDYTPNLNFFGTDSFTYTVSDGTLSSSAVVTVTVNPVNDPPVALDNSYNMAEDTTLTVIAAAGILTNDSDVEGDGLTAVLVNDVASGTLALASDGGFTFTPVLNFTGLITFTYQAFDAVTLSNTAVVTINVGVVNDPPLALPDEVLTNEDTAVNIDLLANDSDPEGDLLVVVDVTAPTNGTAVIVGNQVLYTPSPNFNGADALIYTVSDGQLTVQADVFIQVDPVNDAPQFTSTAVTAAQADVLYSYTTAAIDVDLGDTLIVEATTLPAWLTLVDLGNGTAVLSGTPTTADAGDHLVVLQVVDQGELIDTQEFTISVSIVTFTYLPLVANGYTPPVLPADLVITDLQVTANSVTLVIENQGPGPTPDFFWVDFYVNPTEAPSLNRTWQLIAAHGVGWGVTDVVPAGSSVTLTLSSPYFDPVESDFIGLQPGDVLWAQVDSVNLATTHGNVLETNETNNIFGPITFTSSP